MTHIQQPLPTPEELEERLSSILAHSQGRVSIVRRQENRLSSSAPTEFLTVRLPDGERTRLFCKYFRLRARKDEDGEFDPRYEIQVYTRILANAPVTTPRFYGAWTESAGAGGALVLESLFGVPRVSKVPDVSSSMEAAATWLGVFHDHCEHTVGSPSMDFLRRLDSGYYEARLAQMRAANAELLTAHSWLARILDASQSIVELLLEASQTIIHGEFYPDNILVREGAVLPIDWETAAVGAGECDLATLTEGWPEQLAAACREAYIRARSPHSLSTGFSRRLHAAYLANHIHRLGWKLSRGLNWRLADLRRLGEALELI